MNLKPAILLLDVDGVLIHNRAYRAALRQTVAWFGQRLSVGGEPPTDNDIDVFESQSIIVEWDSTAICTAALLLEKVKAAPHLALPADWWAALAACARTPTPPVTLDFAALARRVGEAANQQWQRPTTTALALFTADAQALTTPDPNTLRQLLHTLLAHTYEVPQAPCAQVFQNFVLGHTLYAQHYGLTPHFETEPLLEKLDQPSLKPAVCQRLIAARTAGRVFPAIYTARPSLAPKEIVPPPPGFTPEAEIARRMVGLPDSVPAIGFGKMDWMARRVGRAGVELVKPSPVQSIAAMGAARTGHELEALKAALAIERGDHLRWPLTACAGHTVHVLEDSPSSLRAVTQAVAMLNRQGLGLKLVRHGIAPARSPKRTTLKAIADVLHKSVNEGVEAVLAAG